MKNFKYRLKALEQEKALANGCKIALCKNDEQKKHSIRTIQEMHNKGPSRQQKLIIVFLHPDVLPGCSKDQHFLYEPALDEEIAVV